MACAPRDATDAADATGADPATINLADDDWELTLLECLPGETECSENLERLTQSDSDSDEASRTYQVSIPENLHQRFAWFHGRAVLRKSFASLAGATAAFPDAGLLSVSDPALLIGGIGSVDTLRVNGVAVGSTGAAPEPQADRFASAWNTVRFYRIPSKLLRESENTIEIEFWAVNVKAGLHRGPVLIGSQSALRSDYLWYRLIYQDVLFAQTVLLLFGLLYFLSGLRKYDREDGFHLMALTFFGLMIHSLYFLELPLALIAGLNHLLFLKVQWFALAIAMQSASHFQWRLTRLPRRLLDAIAACVVASGLIALVFVENYAQYYLVVALHQSAMILAAVHSFLYAWRYRRMANTKHLSIVFVGGAMVALPAFAMDAALRFYLHNYSWVFQYTVIGNIIHFFNVSVDTLFAWKLRAEGYRKQVGEERVRIAREVHDTVGSHLTEIVLQSESLQGNSGGDLEGDSQGVQEKAAIVRSLARSSLERIRDIVGMLSSIDKDGDQNREVESLEEYIRSHADRIRNLERYTVELDLADPGAQSKRESRQDAQPARNSKTASAVPSFEQTMHLKRIYAEWMSNVLRHSRPRDLRIALVTRAGWASLRVVDDGTGIAWRGERLHSGLANIAERVEILGGRVRSFRFARGNVFLCRVPLRADS
ncbi:MAG: histidine kinase [bacterium]|nr:histidine kinase [bacterium]